MNKSESIINLTKAMIEAQSEIPMLKTNAYNSFNDTHYVDMGLIIETVRPVLKQHGLVILQPATSDGSRVGVETIILHESGEYISVSACMDIQMEKGKTQMQAAGSAISYLRRYSLISTLELYTKDEKGGGSGGGQRATKPAKPAGSAPSQPSQEHAEQKYKFNDAPIVAECARVWKCQLGEASVTLHAEKANHPEMMTVREASAWAQKFMAQTQKK